MLINNYNINKKNVDSRPQILLWADEQGWSYNNITMNDTLRARNICYAQNLSLSYDGVIGVTHNYFAISPNNNIQGGEQYGLLPI